MEYIFGYYDNGTETLKTKDTAHSNLTGFQIVSRDYDDCIITDSFYVIKKTASNEDAEGMCYDWYLIDKHSRYVDKTKCIEAKIDSITPEMIHAAPAGYGLGGGGIDKLEQVVDDFNNYTRNGWYYVVSTTNVLNTPDVIYGYGVLQVTAASSIIKQELLVPDWSDPNKVQWRILQRVNTGTWSDWEWVNPRMALGVEYRTTERYLGKPVYVKAINCGALPAKTTKSVAHGIANFGACVDITAVIDGAINIKWLEGMCYYADATNVIVRDTLDYSGYVSSIFTIKYTKTTD